MEESRCGEGLPIDAPPARFIQWKAVLHTGNPAPVLERVAVNYLPRNVAPEVEDVTVTGGRARSVIYPNQQHDI